MSRKYGKRLRAICFVCNREVALSNPGGEVYSYRQHKARAGYMKEGDQCAGSGKSVTAGELKAARAAGLLRGEK